MITPLKILLTFLNENVYSNMKRKKDVKYLKSGPLGGRLLHEIDVYAKSCVDEALKRERESKPDNVVDDWDIDKVYPEGSIKN